MLKVIELFVFWYPAIMSVFWMVGAIIFSISNERKKPLPLYETPMVSILVPCFNEEETIEKTQLLVQNSKKRQATIRSEKESTGSKNESTLKFYESAGYNSSDKTAFIQWLD